MRTYKLSQEAEEDMHEIYLYSCFHFNKKQADKYSQKLKTAFDMIVENSKIGRYYLKANSKYRRFEVNQHIIFYQIIEEAILIVRILHRDMDIIQIIN